MSFESLSESKIPSILQESGLERRPQSRRSSYSGSRGRSRARSSLITRLSPFIKTSD